MFGEDVGIGVDAVTGVDGARCTGMDGVDVIIGMDGNSNEW